MRKVGKDGCPGTRRKDSAPPKPVEIAFTYAIRDHHGEPHTFRVAVDLIQGELDLGVSLTGEKDELPLLPEELFGQVQQALSLVRERVKSTDLVERDD